MRESAAYIVRVLKPVIHVDPYHSPENQPVRVEKRSQTKSMIADSCRSDLPGIFRDDVQIYPYQMRLWNDFNICWLSVCQMQKDLTQEIIQRGQQRPHVSLISAEYLDHMGKQLIRLCDQVEEHGLVDYQIGFWEEEILSSTSLLCRKCDITWQEIYTDLVL